MNPIIGISTNFLTVDKGKFLGMERIYVNKDYVDVIAKAGGVPLLLPPVADADIIARYANICHGFVLSGGGDVNPLLYHQSPRPGLEEFHTQLDRSQWMLTEEILKTGKPLLAICRGLQLLNVVLGGTLWQDMDDVDHPVMLHSQNSPRGDAFHSVNIARDSLLYRLFGEKIEVNSFHHQCLRQIGRGLKITAKAEDGIVEAVELPSHLFGIGIQWHPEMMMNASPRMLPLFQELIHSCK